MPPATIDRWFDPARHARSQASAAAAWAAGHAMPPEAAVADALNEAPATPDTARPMEHVMAPLGVHSRAEVAAWAAPPGLPDPAATEGAHPPGCNRTPEPGENPLT